MATKEQLTKAINTFIENDMCPKAEVLCDILKEHVHDLHADQDIASLWHRAKSMFHIM